MFLPVSSIPEEYLYRLLPQGVIDLDKRHLMEAILGGYQDRISDLRSYANNLSELVKPDAQLPQLSFNVVLVRFTGPAGQVVTRSLDLLPSTPSLDDTEALKAWAIEQTGLDPTQVLSVVAGTDVLRKVDIDSISLLAENVGALLYPGLNDTTPDEARKTRQRLLESWFPRLKIKGTAQSFEVLGRIIGFEEVAVTPLWSRLVPHKPNDPGHQVNDPDFSARPEQVPSASLPDTRYDPLDFTDSIYFDWSSGPLSESADSANYWPLAINNRNPFVKITVLGSIVQRPAAGRYVLSGGASNRPASILLDKGTVVSNLRATAIADGDAFNGLRVNVIEYGGTAVGLTISDRMSAVKYRSSYFDLKATILASGTESAQPSEDLERTPWLTSDGTATAPFRPWTGGSVTSSVTFFPNVSVSQGNMARTRVQAEGTTPQYSQDQFGKAEQTVENFESLRAATRRIRAKGVGPALHDDAKFAAYAGETTLFVAAVGSVFGQGTYEGIVPPSAAPTPPYRLHLQAYIGSNPRPTFMDSVVAGTISAAGDGFLGFYSLSDNYFRMLVSAGTFGANGTMKAFYLADAGTVIRSEPSYQSKANGTVGFLSRPEDQPDYSRKNTSLHDEDPWSRRPVFAGEELDQDLYLPKTDDPALTSAEPPYKVLALSGHQYELAVLDGSKQHVPYRFKVLQTEESNPITGEAIRTTYDRLLLALDQGDNLYHTLLIDDIVVATQYWSPAKWRHIVQWVPFNEHPLDSIVPHNRYAQEVDSDVRHYNRLWDAARGWFTRFEQGDKCVFSTDLSLGGEYTLATWIRSESSLKTGSATKIIELGNSLQLRLTPGGASSVSLLVLVGGLLTTVATVSVPIEQWNFLAVRVSGDTVDIGVGTSSISWSTYTVSGLDAINSQSIRVESTARTFGLHDLTVWSVAKTDEELELVRAPSLVASPVPYPTPYVESLSRDNRYVMRLLSSGFVYPDVEEIIQKPYVPGYAQRYRFDGLYEGDERFKQVGLGDGNGSLASYPLGLRGVEVEGFGRTLLSGSNVPLPGNNAQWNPTAGTSLRVVPPFGGTGGTVQTPSAPSSPWPNQLLNNPAQDRIYVKGSDGLVYKVFVDDLGAGAALRAEPVMQERPALEAGTLPTHRAQPTDAQTILGSPGKRLSVQVSGTTYTPYEASDAGQTLTTPPIYLYRQSVMKVNALSTATAFARWANRNAFGQSLSIPALEENGSLDFANTEGLVSGNYQLTLDVGNIGTVDDDFSGFSTNVSVVGSGGTVLTSVAAILLPDAKGNNPRGNAQVFFQLPAPVNTNWVLSVDWNNDRDVPRKGQKRQLAIYGYELRLASPALYRVSANPLTLTAVNLSDTSNIRPGGLFGEINSYGTIAAIRHEAQVYPKSSVWPLSNLLTTSTWARRENLRVLNPVVEPDPAIPSIPLITSLSVIPNALYNIGETATLAANVIGSGTVAAYVWRFWDSTVETTDLPQVSKVVTPGVGSNFAGSFSLSVVDRFGNTANASSVVLINKPPLLEISADRTVGIFPYTAELNGTYTDPEGAGVSLLWFDSGTQFASGSPVIYTATKSAQVTCLATDAAGGMTERKLAFEGSPHLKPIVSPIIRPDAGRISHINEVSFAVYALDPNRGSTLSFQWTHWNGTSAGTTTQVANSNARFNQITLPLDGQTPGTKLVRVTVSDPEGYSTIVQTTIELLANVPPIISSVTTSSPGALAGAAVPFAAVAVDQDGDPPGFTWNFMSPRAMVLYGGNVQYPTIPADAGGIIQGTLVVDDSNGGQASAEIPPVFVATQYIRSLTVSNVPGFYITGFNQEITSQDDGVMIRYSLDGTDIFKITDGIEYTGVFAFLPPEGGTGKKILKARAFKTGFAPSEQFTGEYTFYDPNATAATTPDVGAGTTTVTLTTVQSSADSLVTAAEIPGDNQKTDTKPTAQIAGMSAAALANEPQLPFTPAAIGSVTAVSTAGQQFVVLKNSI